MKKVFELSDPISNEQNDILFKIYNQAKASKDFIHNLTADVCIPIYVKSLLWLGLKYNFNLLPKWNDILKCMQEGIRKLGWYCHFFPNIKSLSKLEKTVVYSKKHKKSVFRSNLEKDIFKDTFKSCKQFVYICKSHSTTKNLFPIELILNFKEFQLQNSLVIKPADKNAGICIMNKVDYDNEIFSQLNDETCYLPSTLVHFYFKMEYLCDEIKYFKNSFPEHFEINKMIPPTYKPAKFYILPKVHKPFTGFPKGRPISSTISTVNRNISKVLDGWLQPVMNFMSDVIIDTSHFLLLLNDVKLLPNKKYMLVTADVCSLYTNLKKSTCFNNCVSEFAKFKHLINYPFNLSEQNLEMLMKWSLNYSFLEYDNNIFVQHRGIQMGNNASVSIANITVCKELELIFRDKPEIIFRPRFIDDIFMILDTTDIIDVNLYLKDLLTHEYLEFTYELSDEKINFLDLTVILDSNNVLSTQMYKKPINKHQFLLYDSSHPNHLLNSLPYSACIRIIRNCSDPKVADFEIKELFSKLLSRNYPTKVLEDCKIKLRNVTRIDILKPKKPLIIQNLRIHNPHILSVLGCVPNLNQCNLIPSNKLFITMPFYKSIPGLNVLLRKYLHDKFNRTHNPIVRTAVADIKIVVSFKITNNLSRQMNCGG